MLMFNGGVIDPKGGYSEECSKLEIAWSRVRFWFKMKLWEGVRELGFILHRIL
jgi:hypothetical protein